MKCIFCGHTESKVNDSRDTSDFSAIRRRRECQNPKCGKRFTTFETVEMTPVLVVKAGGERQAFNAQKIKSGIIKSCEKRPVSLEQINKMVENIEKAVHNSLKSEISSTEIGEMVMDELKRADEVAYVRFASVYRKFKDLSQFIELFENMIKKS